MYEDYNLVDFIVNVLSEAKYKQLVENGEVQPNQIYCTPDTLLEQLANKADVDLNNTQAFKKTGGELLGEVLKDGVLARSPSETELMIKAGSDTTNEDGALFVLYGKNGVSAGQFLARACSADGKIYDLRGAPNGSLEWGGKHVLREQAGSIGASGYIKLSTGLVMQWGITSSGAENHTISLPTSFSGGGTYQVMTTPFSNSGPFYDSSAYERTATYFKIRSAANAAGVQIQWFAIGY